jgi:hypothetical protein
MRKYAALFHAENRTLKPECATQQCSQSPQPSGERSGFCAECTNTEAFMKKLQAFSVIVLTLLGGTFFQQRANPSSSNRKPADTPPTNISRTEVGPSLRVPFR